MRRRLFTNPYKASLRESAKMVAPSEETTEKILGSVMKAAGVAGAVSLAAASAKAASLGKTALIKTVGTVAAASVGVTAVAVTGTVMMVPPKINSVDALTEDWHSSSIAVATQNNLSTRQVTVTAENGDTFVATRDESGQYMVDVYQNGAYTVEVTGQGGRAATAEVTVSHIDNEIPAMVRHSVGEDSVTLFFADEGSGVDWSSISAADASGSPVRPLAVNPDQGSVVFALPDSNLDILVQDMAGNLGKTTIYVTEQQ